jgi:hypothetical protein
MCIKVRNDKGCNSRVGGIQKRDDDIGKPKVYATYSEDLVSPAQTW